MLHSCDCRAAILFVAISYGQLNSVEDEGGLVVDRKYLIGNLEAYFEHSERLRGLLETCFGEATAHSSGIWSELDNRDAEMVRVRDDLVGGKAENLFGVGSVDEAITKAINATVAQHSRFEVMAKV